MTPARHKQKNNNDLTLSLQHALKMLRNGLFQATRAERRSSVRKYQVSRYRKEMVNRTLCSHERLPFHCRYLFIYLFIYYLSYRTITSNAWYDTTVCL